MLIPQTADLLAAEEHERGRNVVVCLDEAHLLGVDQLEELRLLTNAELDSHSPFACLLVGQPTLRRRIKLGTFAALDQRIALRYAMNGMEAAETKSYLAHNAASAVMRREAPEAWRWAVPCPTFVRIIQGSLAIIVSSGRGVRRRGDRRVEFTYRGARLAG